MLDEVLTRIDVAHDQALTAAVVGPREHLPEEDRQALSTAIDLLKSILDRHKAHG